MTGAAAIAAAAGLSSSMAATAPAFVNGASNHAPVTTAPVSVTVAGGTGPFTYACALVDTTGETWTIGSPTAATTTFTCTNVADGETSTAHFRWTVTDSLGATAVSNDIEVNATATHRVLEGP